MTVHGPGFGLDEREAFRSQIAGIMDALQKDASHAIREIVIVEIDPRRAQRLTTILHDALPAGGVDTAASPPTKRDAPDVCRSAGVESDRKRKVFVAMPFDDTMDDVYHYGVQNAVHAAGYLCERADQANFTGEIVDWIKKRIASADLVIADLTHSNPMYIWKLVTPGVRVVRPCCSFRMWST